MTIKKICILVLSSWCLVLFLSGCATVPTKEALPIYNINGSNYVSLLSLCESEHIEWEYDMFTKTVELTKGTHKINLVVGDTLMLVDGSPVHLKYPVEMHQGTVALPHKFKEQILSPLFKESYPAAKVSAPLSKIKRIVVDAGHGGKDPGTIGRSGLREKDVNLDIAKRLAKLLKSDGFDVVMTRSTDVFIPLEGRAAIANNCKTDLFISVHANANRVRSLNGFEVYYVSPNVSDSKRALNCAENATLSLASASFAHPASFNLKATLWDMIHTNNRAESIRLSRYICRAIENNLETRVLGIKGAPFYVLKGAYSPAVLIEIGFLSNYNEERRIKNSYYRQQIAENIAQGIRNYARGFSLLQEARR